MDGDSDFANVEELVQAMHNNPSKTLLFRHHVSERPDFWTEEDFGQYVSISKQTGFFM